jgi:hypothetical protein
LQHRDYVSCCISARNCHNDKPSSSIASGLHGGMDLRFADRDGGWSGYAG